MPSPASGTFSILGIGGLMLLGGPLLTGALAGIAAGVLLGAGGALLALALCAPCPPSWSGCAAVSRAVQSAPKV